MLVRCVHNCHIWRACEHPGSNCCNHFMKKSSCSFLKTMMQKKFKPYSLRSAFGVVEEEQPPPPSSTTDAAPLPLLPSSSSINSTSATSPTTIEYVYIKPTSCQKCKCHHCTKAHERQEFLLWIIVIIVVFILIKVMST